MELPSQKACRGPMRIILSFRCFEPCVSRAVLFFPGRTDKESF